MSIIFYSFLPTIWDENLILYTTLSVYFWEPFSTISNRDLCLSATSIVFVLMGHGSARSDSGLVPRANEMRLYPFLASGPYLLEKNESHP